MLRRAPCAAPRAAAAGRPPRGSDTHVTARSIGMVGAEPPKGGMMASMMGGGGGAAPTAARKATLGAYVHDFDKDAGTGSRLYGKVTEEMTVTGRWEQMWSKRLRTTVAARVMDPPAGMPAAAAAGAASTGEMAATATYRGSTYTAVGRGVYGGATRRPGPIVGGSYLQSVTPHVALGGEAYLNTAEFMRNRQMRADVAAAARGEAGKCSRPGHAARPCCACGSRAARSPRCRRAGARRRRQGRPVHAAEGVRVVYCGDVQHEAAAVYRPVWWGWRGRAAVLLRAGTRVPARQAGHPPHRAPARLALAARSACPRRCLACRIVTRSHGWRQVGGSVQMPRTHGKVTASISSVGRVKSVWERRLLSTVRLRVSRVPSSA